MTFTFQSIGTGQIGKTTDNIGLTSNDNFVKFHIMRTYNQIFDRKKIWEKQFNDANKKNFYFFSYAHEKQFETAFNMFKDKPIFGHGLKMYRHKCDNYSSSAYGCSSHPHNTYIQLLAETGLFVNRFMFKKILILFLISLSIMMTLTFTFTDNIGLTNNKNFH